MHWADNIKTHYGSLARYMVQKRLPTGWQDHSVHTGSHAPFLNTSDYWVQVNDWPYALPQDVTHLTAWSRIALTRDPESGYLASESEMVVENFIQRYFTDSPKSWEILWFKNPPVAQSIPDLEHIHILVRGADKETLEKWIMTGR
jgi:hypothetical protein